ncbi:MAG: transketolase [Firmicutes bacterium]|nr:transketolase [Alicyclobacillaceae bacterium]MCL6496015.1 transketolase [Bacillota bacterium]
MSQPTEEKMANVFTEGARATGLREAVAQELIRLAEADERVVVLSADMGAAVAAFRERFPNRYFDFGIAETNTISVAAGLAASGFRPYVISMAPFGAIKCAEQIRTDLAYTMMPVRILALLSGVAMGFFGTSHHAVEDIAILRAITNMTVVAPSDVPSFAGLLESTREAAGPVFFRLCEGTETPLYAEPPKVDLGRWPVLREGRDLTLIGTGVGTQIAVQVADQLRHQGLNLRVVDALSLKPLDEAQIERAVAETRGIVTVEEHNVVGGLGSAVAEILGRRGWVAPLATVALPDEDLEVGVPAYLRQRYGLTPEAVADVTRALWSKTGGTRA